MAKDEYGLTPKQRMFADEYIANKGNATGAARKAGYSESSVRDIAKDNLTKPHIRDYIESMTRDALDKRKYNAEQLIFASWGISMGEVQNGYSKQYDHINNEVIKEITYEFTPTVEERQRSIEFLAKLLKLDESDKLKSKLIQAQIDKLNAEIHKDETQEDKMAEYFKLLGSRIDEMD